MLKHLFCFPILTIGAATLSAEVVISEFMASNSSILADEDGDYSDWIEIHNSGSTSVDITNWYLTDDDSFNTADPETYWQFPTRTLAADEHLIVFASGKERAPDETGELHSSFKLSSSGEYLALIQDDGTSIATEYAPSYPAQQTDVSYGLGFSSANTEKYISEGSSLTLNIPSDDSDGSTWAGGNEPFDDSNWTSAKSGIGFDAGAGASGFTLIDDFESLNPTALDGQNDWTATDSRIAIVNDPENVENQILKLDGDNVQAYKPLDLPNGETGTLFFRMRRDGLADAASGIADLATPGSWGSFEAMTNTKSDGILKIRDGGSYQDVGDFDDNTWLFIWLVIDNDNDTYKAYIQGGSFTEQTLLDVDSNTVFEFRNGDASNALQTFYTRTATDNAGTLMLDDIYLGEGENLGIPIGGTGYASLIDPEGNIESDMLSTNSSAYLRFPFDAEDVTDNTQLSLNIRYDDGFIAYLNGTQIASRNTPETPTWNSSATAEHNSIEAVQFENIDVSAFTNTLNLNGANILAIHGLNTSANDSDFLISLELIAETTSAEILQVYFLEPSPESSNTTGFLGLVSDTFFSQDRGFYENAFDVTISTDTSEADIIYTTDGSTPSLFNGVNTSSPATINISTTTTLRAIAVKEGYLSTNVDTQTYIFIADVITQDNTPEGFPTTWLGSGGSGTLPADYEMDTEITTDPAYTNRISDALLAIPTISLVTDQANFFDTSTGIYQRPQQSGSDWERPVSVEIIQPNGEVESIQIDAGIRIQGGHTRNPSNNPKHSLRLIFRSEYGESKLNYDLFPDDSTATTEFDQLVLRAGGNQSWLHHNTFKGDNRGRAQYVRDQWAKDVQLNMGHPTVRNTHAHLYINGVYWGLYNPTERATSAFGESYLGGDKDDYVALNSGEEVSGDEAALTEFQALVDLANSNITDSDVYAQMAELLDLEAFADYMILQQYGGNVDWPHHNWYSIRNTNGGKWYFISWDSEFIFVEPDANVIDQNIHDREGPPLDILDRLMLNTDFRILFADRIQKHLFDNGLLTVDKVLEAWDKRSDEIFEPLVAESARWGDYRRDVHSRGTPITLYDPDNDWMVERNRLLTSYFPTRTETVIDQYRAVGYFPNLEAAVLSSNGGVVAPGHMLTITSPDGGSIYYTTDGSDPRTAITSAVSPNAQLYNGQVAINSSLSLKARILSGGTWSPIIEVSFTMELPSAFESLVVSEIMYNLEGSDDAEFIELVNVGTEIIDLSGVHFTAGIEFEFPEGTQLAPNEFKLIVRDEAAFADVYGNDLPVAGNFANDSALDNSGETITLVTSESSVIRSFTYGDAAPWPEAADGLGYSLELIDPSTNPDHDNPANWQTSSQIGGSPATIIPFDPFADADGDGSPALLERAQGTSDQVANNNSETFYIFEADGRFNLAFLRNPDSGVNLNVLFSINLENWNSADSILEITEQIPTGNGNQVLEIYLITSNEIDQTYFRLQAE